MILDKTREEGLKYLYLQRKIELSSPLADIDTNSSSITIERIHSILFVTTAQRIMEIVSGIDISTPFAEDFTFEAWQKVLSNLLDMCILANKEPKYNFDLIRSRREFVTHPYDTNSHHVLQFLEEFLNAQTLTHDPLNWCELGEKIGLVEYPQ